MTSKTQSKSRWDWVLPWVEPIFAAVVGIVLYFPLQRKDLADIAWVLGLLFTVHSIATTRRLKEEFDTTRKLAEVVDLSQDCDISDVRRILHLYLAIKEAEFKSLRDDIIQECVSRLSSLAHDKTTIAGGSEYYIRWLIETMRSCSQNEKVSAVSVMPESAWIEVPAEKGYLDENIKAAKRGVKIERIFLSSRERLRDQGNREVIYQHMQHSKRGLTAYIVWLEELGAHDSALIQEIGKGFVSFGDRVVLIDTSVPPNEMRGTVMMKPEQLKRYRRLFEQLKLHARIADTELFSKLDNSATS